MNHYIDVTIQPDKEIRQNVLLNTVYTKLHNALVTLNSTDIGISFPQAGLILGRKIRIHGTKDRLTMLRELNWLGGMIGYCVVTDITEVPDNVNHRVVSRIQPNMSASKLRRLRKRNDLSDDDVRAYKRKMFASGLDQPYVELVSASNGKLYRRYILIGDIQENSSQGTFDSFGLSTTASIPCGF